LIHLHSLSLYRVDLDKLSDADYRRLHWYSQHSPRPLRRSDLPPFPKSLIAWEELPLYDNDRKLFPSYRVYKKCCKLFNVQPKPKYKKGIPVSIEIEFHKLNPPPSCYIIYQCLYSCGFYSRELDMRICEISQGMIKAKNGYSFRTIARTMDFLRAHRFICSIWRGRPDPVEPRYRHSCYELPLNFKHIKSWRINNGRKRQNTL